MDLSVTVVADLKMTPQRSTYAKRGRGGRRYQGRVELLQGLKRGPFSRHGAAAAAKGRCTLVCATPCSCLGSIHSRCSLFHFMFLLARILSWNMLDSDEMPCSGYQFAGERSLLPTSGTSLVASPGLSFFKYILLLAQGKTQIMCGPAYKEIQLF